MPTAAPPATDPAARAIARGLAPSWQPGPGRRYFHAGDTVRVTAGHGHRAARYRVIGFRLEAGRTVAELYGGTAGHASLRTVAADLLERRPETEAPR